MKAVSVTIFLTLAKMHFQSVWLAALERDSEQTKAASVGAAAVTVTNVSRLAGFTTSACVCHERRDFSWKEFALECFEIRQCPSV